MYGRSINRQNTEPAVQFLIKISHAIKQKLEDIIKISIITTIAIVLVFSLVINYKLAGYIDLTLKNASDCLIQEIEVMYAGGPVQIAEIPIGQEVNLRLRLAGESYIEFKHANGNDISSVKRIENFFFPYEKGTVLIIFETQDILSYKMDVRAGKIHIKKEGQCVPSKR